MITKGQKINDRYEIIRAIGEGGMANVYLGYDTILDRNVAIKVLRGDLSNDEKFVRRFQREALSASSLAHQNIVEMYDVGEDDGVYYIVMEYVDGKTIKQLLKKRGTLTLSEAIDIMSQLTDGMAHAHDSYIIHRDLKPQNIMIKDDGQIKITDFGIAMALNSTQLTQTNSVMGSVHYLPPEQASGKGCTIKSDIYSMGIIFYELLSGSLPFRGDNAVEIALKHMREPLPSLRDTNNAIPQSIENIIRKSTAKNPKNRYDSARSMHEDLLTALNDERMDEEVYQYKYPENESEAKRAKAKENDNKEDKESKQEKKEEIISDLSADDFTDSEKKGNILKIVIIAILSIIFIGIICAILFVIFVVPEKENKKPVRVPDCEGLKVSQCEKKLQDKGFEVETKIEVVESDTIEKNLIVKTEPSSGRSVKYGSKITLYKSAGEVVCILEDYTGQNSIQVQTLLNTKYGIIVKIEKKEPDEKDKDKEFDEDEIIGQNLAQGSEVKKGEELIIYVPDIKTKFPDFIEEKWSLSDIQSFCDNYGLKLQTEEVEVAPSAGYADGEIMNTNRAKGTDIIKGTTLRVKVAKVVKPVVTPSPSPSASPSPSPSSEPSTE